MFAELVTALQSEGRATLEVTRDRPNRACRNQLIEAARRAGVRISMKRFREDDPPFELVIATVLHGDEAELQQQRDVIFRAVNRVRTGLEILTAGSINTEPIEDQIEDLREIAQELEQYARELRVDNKVSGGATGS